MITTITLSVFLSTACTALIDLIFLIDGSSSVERYGVGNFRRVINFVRDLTTKFVVSKSNTRVAAMVYGTRTFPIFGFKAYSNNKRVFHAFNRPVRYPRTGARTASALKSAYRRFFQYNRRVGAQRVIVVLTDGSSRDRGVLRVARSIKRKGIKIFAVGLGRYFNARELDSMVSKKINEHVFTSDWKQLKHISNDLKKHICLGMYPVKLLTIIKLFQLNHVYKDVMTFYYGSTLSTEKF